MTHGRKTGGRQAGTPNRSTTDSRLAFAALIDGNLEKLTLWLDSVAIGIRKVDPNTGCETADYVVRPNPAKAFEMLMSVVEYHIPKLARTELIASDSTAEQANENYNIFSELIRNIKAQRQAEQNS